MLMGHVLKTVHFIMSLNGALFAVALCLTLPSICFLVLVPRKDEPYKVPLAWLLFGLGIVSCGLVLYSLF
jgi:amino acid transporter